MNTKKKRGSIKAALAVLLILVMSVSLAACGKTAQADDASGAAGALTWSYTKDNKTLTVAGNGNIENYASSADVPWKDVRTSVENVIVTPGITGVGDYAFYYMPSLKSVSLPTDVTAVGKYAFGFCSSLEEITLPDGVTAVGDSAFEACTALKTIVLPMSVTSLGERAFAFCSSLTDATIAAPITEIRAETFYGCRSLNSLVLNTALTEDKVAPNAFEGASRGFADAVRRDTVEGVYTISITYVYEDGSEAKSPIREEKTSGESYLYMTPEIEGYTADKTVVQGTLGATGVSETVTYKKNAETEETTAPEVETTAPTEVEEEDEGVTVGTIVAIVVLVLVIAGIVVGGILLVRMDKKTKNGKNGKNAKNKKK